MTPCIAKRRESLRDMRRALIAQSPGPAHEGSYSAHHFDLCLAFARTIRKRQTQEAGDHRTNFGLPACYASVALTMVKEAGVGVFADCLTP